jgi:hypothetical protein
VLQQKLSENSIYAYDITIFIAIRLSRFWAGNDISGFKKIVDVKVGV